VTLHFPVLLVGDGKDRMKGAWDSIHVFEASEKGRNAHYTLTSTVMLYMFTSKAELGDMNLSGNMTRQVRRGGLVSHSTGVVEQTRYLDALQKEMLDRIDSHHGILDLG